MRSCPSDHPRAHAEAQRQLRTRTLYHAPAVSSPSSFLALTSSRYHITLHLPTHTGAAAATFFPLAANAEAAAIRKANQDDIGVSRVTIGKKGKGSPGAQVPEVPLKTDGWYRSAVIGPSTPTPKPPPPPPPPEPPKEEKKK